MASIPRTTQELADALKQLRETAGLTMVAVSEAAHISRYRLMRLEKHTFTAKPAEVETLADLYGASPRMRKAMLAVSRQAFAGPVPARAILYRGASARMQQRVHQVEQSSTLIRVFQPLVVAGLLQTPGYARVVMSAEGKVTGKALEDAVAARLARQNLDGPRRFVFLMTEGTLRWQGGSREVMAGQLDYLAGIATSRPNIAVGVITHEDPRGFFPSHGFSMYDQRTVILGVWAGTSFINEPEQVRQYAELMAKLEKAAVYGEEAAGIIGRAAALYR